MNPTKLLDDTVSTIGRYAPAILVHALLFALISAWVLRPDVLPSGETAWSSLTNIIDSSLKAIGLNVERWYVLVFLGIGYLTVFQWAMNLVSSLPLFGVVHRVRYDDFVISHAAVVLRLPPNLNEIGVVLGNLIDDTIKEAAESGGNNPYQHLIDRSSTLHRYYGALLIALAAALAWALEGGSLSKSPDRVWQLVLLLTAICFVLRWKMARDFVDNRNQLAFWALRSFERREVTRPPDPLERSRSRAVLQQIALQKAFRRHPINIVQAAIRRIPFEPAMRSVSETFRQRLKYPRLMTGTDWEIFASAALKQSDETNTPPRALSVEAFEERLFALLECTGAGLCILAPRSLALAPSVDGGGSSYDFALRRHGGYLLRIALTDGDSLDGNRISVANHEDSRAFIRCLGDQPIERLAQGDFPNSENFSFDLLPPYENNDVFDPQAQPDRDNDLTRYFENSAPLRIGSSYLAGFKTRNGTHVAIGFQCFRIAESEKLLVAWRILKIWKPDENPSQILPWWQPSAWREMWRPPQNNRHL
ncbi:hypothetical protein [Microbaculum marinum]|uniref:ResB-like domain-containing protein n=1 Tax=Microbaculum marinum TaxID=1764581 RepID=A0AAW9RTC1_9HYPH